MRLKVAAKWASQEEKEIIHKADICSSDKSLTPAHNQPTAAGNLLVASVFWKLKNLKKATEHLKA